MKSLIHSRVLSIQFVHLLNIIDYKDSHKSLKYLENQEHKIKTTPTYTA